MKLTLRLTLAVLVVSLLVAIATLSVCSDLPVKPAPAYIGNMRSYVFHRRSCSYLPHEKNRSYFDSREEAIDAGYRPCMKCEP